MASSLMRPILARGRRPRHHSGCPWPGSCRSGCGHPASGIRSSRWTCCPWRSAAQRRTSGSSTRRRRGQCSWWKYGSSCSARRARPWHRCPDPARRGKRDAGELHAGTLALQDAHRVQAARVGAERAGDPLDRAALFDPRTLGVQVVHILGPVFNRGVAHARTLTDENLDAACVQVGDVVLRAEQPR